MDFETGFTAGWVILQIVAAIWIWMDGKRRRVKNTAGWAVATFFLFIPVILYLLWGRNQVEAPLQPQYTPQPGYMPQPRYAPPLQYPPQRQYAPTSQPQYAPQPQYRPPQKYYPPQQPQYTPSAQPQYPPPGTTPGSRSCGRCGASVPPGNRFCVSCGAPLQQ